MKKLMMCATIFVASCAATEVTKLSVDGAVEHPMSYERSPVPGIYPM